MSIEHEVGEDERCGWHVMAAAAALRQGARNAASYAA